MQHRIVSASALNRQVSLIAATSQEPVFPDTGFVRQALLLRFIPFSKATLWRRVKAGLFPAPIKLSVGITAWRAEEIRRWISEQR